MNKIKLTLAILLCFGAAGCKPPRPPCRIFVIDGVRCVYCQGRDLFLPASIAVDCDFSGGSK